MAAVILAFAMTGCIALAAVSDLVSNFLSLVVMVIARIILRFCDLIMNPLLEITQMTTEEIADYIPGFAMSGDGIGGYFSQAIMVISTTIAGALIAVRVISYLMEVADGARTESVAKLIWNAVFGMVLTITGSHFLQLMFDEIISPLTKALSEGVSGGGLGDFSFEKSGMTIIGLADSGDVTGTITAWMGGFSIVEGASLVVSVVFLFLIWWNLIKLVLECAERYIICVFTILLSPLAFATATNERTKDTAVNWMQMFWSQCVLLILNIWVVGIARTALNAGLIGASVESVVKWGLVTYAYLKIAQKLDDMLSKAGFRITSTTGLDPMSEASGAFRILAGGAHDALNLAGTIAGHGRAAADAVGNVVGGAGSNSKPIDTNPAAAAGANGAATGAASNLDKYGKVSFGDKEKADRFVRSTNAERSDMYNNPGETFNSNSNRQAMANALDELGFDGGKVSQGTVEDLAPDNAIKGAVNGKVTYRDENGKITGVSGFRYSSDESGTTATKTSDLAISPDGQSAILTTDKGKFRLENTGRTAANGSQEWTATRMTDGKGRNLRDTYPDMDTMDTKSFSVPAGQLNKYGADGAAAIAARSAIEGNTLDYLTANTDYAIKRNDKFNAESAAWSAKWAEAKENYAGRFQMSNEQRAAEMRNPDSAVDYNSQESLAAMQDTLANADPELAEQFAKGAKVTGIDMAMGRDDMPDGALTVTVSDGNTTDTYMVSTPKGSLTDEEAAQVIASGQLPKGTAEGTGASENVTGDAGNATMVDGDATAKETDATVPDENGQIAYNSLADDDSEQEVTGAEVGDTVGMTSEAFEATHTPVAAMDEPEPEATSFWGRVASVFSGRHGNNESSEPGVVNPDTVAQGGTTDNVPTGSGVPTSQKATATTTATGVAGSANAANTANGTTINANSSAGATAAGGTASRPVGANNVNVVNPDAVANGSGFTRAASTPAGAPSANGTADSKPINAANVTVTGASAPVNASGTSTNVPQAKSGNGTPTNATVEGSATPLVNEGNAPISGGGTATNKDVASADYAEPLTDAGNVSGNGAVTENSGSTDSETQFTDDGSATVQTDVPAGQADNVADDVSGDGTVNYAEPPANADSTSGGGAAPVVQHTGSEPMVNESDDSDTSSGYVGGTENVGSADMDASPMDGDSAIVETHAPASRTGGTADADDEVAVDAGSDHAEPPADAGGASNDVAAPSAQHADSDGISGEGDTGFTGDNDGGGNYSSDEETAPSTQIAKASVAEDDSYIGEPPAKGESSSDVGAIAGHAAPSADGDGDDFNDNDVGSASFGGSNDSSHDENPDSDASSGSGEETSNDNATTPTVRHQNVGNGSPNDGSSSDDNGGPIVNAPTAPAPEAQGDGAASPENSGSGNGGSAGQTNPAAPVTEDAAPTKTAPKVTAEAPKADENPAPVAQNDKQGDTGVDAGGSDGIGNSDARKQPIEKPPVDGSGYYGDTDRGNSFSTSSGPEIRPLSHVSIKAFNDTNGFVESDGIGRIQVTRVGVDRETGITQWRIMQKLDADGNVPEVPDVMNIERSAKYNKRTRQYEPETFESIARQLGKVDDYESVGPDTDESYKRRSQNPKQVKPQFNVRSDVQPQQKNAYEGKSFRERNTRNERNERNNRFQQMMQGNKSHNASKSKKDKPSK